MKKTFCCNIDCKAYDQKSDDNCSLNELMSTYGCDEKIEEEALLPKTKQITANQKKAEGEKIT
jgi:hypothetical protein